MSKSSTIITLRLSWRARVTWSIRTWLMRRCPSASCKRSAGEGCTSLPLRVRLRSFLHRLCGNHGGVGNGQEADGFFFVIGTNMPLIKTLEHAFVFIMSSATRLASLSAGALMVVAQRHGEHAQRPRQGARRQVAQQAVECGLRVIQGLFDGIRA